MAKSQNLKLKMPTSFLSGCVAAWSILRKVSLASRKHLYYQPGWRRKLKQENLTILKFEMMITKGILKLPELWKQIGRLWQAS